MTPKEEREEAKWLKRQRKILDEAIQNEADRVDLEIVTDCNGLE